MWDSPSRTMVGSIATSIPLTNFHPSNQRLHATTCLPADAHRALHWQQSPHSRLLSLSAAASLSSLSESADSETRPRLQQTGRNERNRPIQLWLFFCLLNASPAHAAFSDGRQRGQPLTAGLRITTNHFA